MPGVQTLNGRTVVVVNPAKVAALMESPHGPVVRDLFVRGERVKKAMQRLAPRRTGNLADHIVKRLAREKGGHVMLVGVSGVPYAVWVVEGSEPHQITAVRGPLLVFYWPKLGRVVAFPSVQHKGNKPNRFMLQALRAGVKF